MEDLNNTIGAIRGKESTDEWLKEPYVGRVTVKGVYYSENHKNKKGEAYTGVPFFKFLVLTKTGSKYMITLFRPGQSDDDEKTDRKLKRIKRLLDHCGADESIEDNQKYMESIIGKECQVVLQKVEEIDTYNVPKIVSRIKFWFSKPLDEELSVNQNDLIKNLSEADLQKFDKAKMEYDARTPKAEESDKSAIKEAQGSEEPEQKNEEEEF